MSMESLSSIFVPIVSLFSYTQIESLLYAFLPSRLEGYKTGIYAVDTFVITASVALILMSLKLIRKAIEILIYGETTKVKPSNEITVMIEPIHYDDYHSTPNIYHQALSRLISIHAQKNKNGVYKLKPNTEIDHEETDPPAFNMVPEPDQTHTIRHDGNSFKITFQINNDKAVTADAASSSSVLPGSEFSKAGIRSSTSNEPYICVSILSSNKQTVATISNFLQSITRDYMKLKTKKNRSRYEYAASGKWVRICSLYEVQGLDTVALSPENETFIRQDLTSFKNNKAFYKKIGFPYKRGFALFGPPGTGKTSLVFAIASELNRDLYFINLSYIDSDSELFQSFSNVPSNSIVVFEDVDTMSSSLLPRNNNVIEVKNKFNLSTFLSILDGHTLEEGIIFIMTTNHPERLDPAIIRPGRMDVHLQLGYATYYQMRRIYKMVMETDDNTTLDDIYPNLEQEITQQVIPPSEIMQIMVLCRNKKSDIPNKLIQLNKKYKCIG